MLGGGRKPLERARQSHGGACPSPPWACHRAHGNSQAPRSRGRELCGIALPLETANLVSLFCNHPSQHDTRPLAELGSMFGIQQSCRPSCPLPGGTLDDAKMSAQEQQWWYFSPSSAPPLPNQTGAQGYTTSLENLMGRREDRCGAGHPSPAGGRGRGSSTVARQGHHRCGWVLPRRRLLGLGSRGRLEAGRLARGGAQEGETRKFRGRAGLSLRLRHPATLR